MSYSLLLCPLGHHHSTTPLVACQPHLWIKRNFFCFFALGVAKRTHCGYTVVTNRERGVDVADLTMGQKIKALREENNLTLEQVGNAVGVGKSTVRKWENGIIANMRRDKIADLAKVLHTTPAYLMGWKEEIELDNLFRIEKRKFPLLGNIACGTPIFANEEKELYVEAGANIHADFCLKAKGDSMIGARIYDGDIVFIRKQEMVDDGEIAAVLIGDEATLKRVQYNPEENELLLFAENPKYKTMRYTGEELNHIRILGKAVAFQSDIR